MSDLPAVVGVAVIGHHKLRLLFDDGTAGDVDLSSMEWRGGARTSSRSRVFRKSESRPVSCHCRLAQWRESCSRDPLRESAQEPSHRRLGST